MLKGLIKIRVPESLWAALATFVGEIKLARIPGGALDV